MTAAGPFPHLFTPLTVGRRSVRNRVVLPATLTNYASHHRITQRWIDFLVERAKGGTGMIITEIIAVDPDALAQGGIVAGYEPGNESGFRKTADLVGNAGACLVAQLWHPGRQQLWSPVASPKGVSDQPDALSWTVPHVMSTSAVRKVIDEYVHVAERMHRCGFAGVELHGAHGYLITQFLSPWSNSRKDEYGGSLENRTRFIKEVSQAIRQVCGPDFIIGLKMPGTEGVTGGIDPDDAMRITAELSATGLIDYFAYSQGNFSLSLEAHVPDMAFRRGHFLDIHKKIRPAAAGIPVMAMGRIALPAEAEAALVEGCCDLVAMSRALIADAAWANKAASGRDQAIRVSTFDNAAWGEIHVGKPLEEVQNPQLGRPGESEDELPQAKRGRRVLVVGSGPAGIQAALTAVARGHRVTLAGKGPVLGGKLRLEASLPNRSEYLGLIAWWERKLQDSGVQVQPNTPIQNIEDVQRFNPEVVVLATGSHQRSPEHFTGPGMSAREWAQSPSERAKRGQTAVVFDKDHTAATYALAEELAGKYGRVVLLTPRTQIAHNVNYCSAIGVYRRLYQANVEIVTAAEPVSLADRTLVWRNVFTEKHQEIPGVDLLVWSTPRIADDTLYFQLQSEGLEALLVGDCMSPRNALCAVHEAHATALSL
jgi:2,4-dienoyl-CoA reductase-like NADH-dependent reductase (Old Yellow Enzyme family)/thioredoxin reductase